MNQKPVSPHLRFLVEAERTRPDAPPNAKALAEAKLAALLGPDAGLDGGDAGNTGTIGNQGSPVNSVSAGASGIGAAKLVGALLLGGVVGGGVVAGVLRPTERVVHVDRVSPSGTPSPSPVVSSPAIAVVDVSSLPTVSASVRTSRSAPAASSARSHDGDLSAERAILERARSALARGDAAGALVAVDQHERGFPNGQLAEEREVVAVQALVAAGRTQEAAERGARFRKAFPNSVLLPIVDQALR